MEVRGELQGFSVYHQGGSLTALNPNVCVCASGRRG